MAIKAVFFDLDGTLIGGDSLLVKGAAGMLAEIAGLGLKVVVGSNLPRSRVVSKIRAAGIAADLILSSSDVGARKPSPKFCFEAASRLDIRKNEMVYVGDDNLTDAICAINAGVLYLNAQWSNRKPKYGIIAATPKDVVRLIRSFLLHDPLWYWQLQTKDRKGIPIDVRSLLPGGKEWNAVLGNPTFNVLKRDIDTEFPVFMKFSRFLLLHLLTTIYLDELHDRVDTWCIIPPSGGNTHRKLLPDFIKGSTQLFKAAFVSDLILRHRASEKAAYARAAGSDPGFLNQANTLHLNPSHRGKVHEKHVLVIDDYCTRGHSFEAARHLLYLGGAREVTCVSVGRYGTRLQTQLSRSGLEWDPWLPQQFEEGDFEPLVFQAPSNLDALPPVLDAFNYLGEEA